MLPCEQELVQQLAGSSSGSGQQCSSGTTRGLLDFTKPVHSKLLRQQAEQSLKGNKQGQRIFAAHCKLQQPATATAAVLRLRASAFANAERIPVWANMSLAMRNVENYLTRCIPVPSLAPPLQQQLQQQQQQQQQSRRNLSALPAEAALRELRDLVDLLRLLAAADYGSTQLLAQLRAFVQRTFSWRTPAVLLTLVVTSKGYSAHSASKRAARVTRQLCSALGVDLPAEPTAEACQPELDKVRKLKQQQQQRQHSEQPAVQQPDEQQQQQQQQQQQGEEEQLQEAGTAAGDDALRAQWALYIRAAFDALLRHQQYNSSLQVVAAAAAGTLALWLQEKQQAALGKDALAPKDSRRLRAQLERAEAGAKAAAQSTAFFGAAKTAAEKFSDAVQQRAVSAAVSQALHAGGAAADDLRASLAHQKQQAAEGGCC
jgi:hypothetical protein